MFKKLDADEILWTRLTPVLVTMAKRCHQEFSTKIDMDGNTNGFHKAQRASPELIEFTELLGQTLQSFDSQRSSLHKQSQGPARLFRNPPSPIPGSALYLDHSEVFRATRVGIRRLLVLQGALTIHAWISSNARHS